MPNLFARGQMVRASSTPQQSGPSSRANCKEKVIESETVRSATYDFLLMIHSNHGPIPYRY